MSLTFVTLCGPGQQSVRSNDAEPALKFEVVAELQLEGNILAVFPRGLGEEGCCDDDAAIGTLLLHRPVQGSDYANLNITWRGVSLTFN